MRITEAAFVNQHDPRVAAGIIAHLRAIEAPILALMGSHHDVSGALALTLNDIKTVTARLAPAAAFMNAVPSLPEFLDPARHL